MASCSVPVWTNLGPALPWWAMSTASYHQVPTAHTIAEPCWLCGVIKHLCVAVRLGGQQPKAIVIKSLALTVPFPCHYTKSVLLRLGGGEGGAAGGGETRRHWNASICCPLLPTGSQMDSESGLKYAQCCLCSDAKPLMARTLLLDTFVCSQVGGLWKVRG